MDDPDLDRLTQLLAHCLGQIDAQAARLFAGTEPDDPELLRCLDVNAGRVQDLVAAIVAHERSRARLGHDLNRLVGKAVQWLLDNKAQPLVVRGQFAEGLPPVPCPGVALDLALRRLLDLAAAHAGFGGELRIGTSRTDDSVLLQVRCRGAGSTHLEQRARTLQDFVAGMQGRCTVDVGQDGDLQLQLELPAALEPDDH